MVLYNVRLLFLGDWLWRLDIGSELCLEGAKAMLCMMIVTCQSQGFRYALNPAKLAQLGFKLLRIFFFHIGASAWET